MQFDSNMLPKFSIISPSFNQGVFLEETILSVLNQNYPNLEYIIIDGGSTDNSLEIIQKYENKLAFWVSEQDEGQYHAINKGFSHSSGDVMAWLNSDDMYLSWTLQTVGNIFSQHSDINWLTSSFPMSANWKGEPVYCRSINGGFSRDGFMQGKNFAGGDWQNNGYIQQESTFWRRELWDKVGGRIDESFSLAADFELWTRFFEHAELIGVEIPLALFRNQPDQRSSVHIQEYIKQCHDILRQYGGKVPSPARTYLRLIFQKLLKTIGRKRNASLKYREPIGWGFF